MPFSPRLLKSPVNYNQRLSDSLSLVGKEFLRSWSGANDANMCMIQNHVKRDFQMNLYDLPANQSDFQENQVDLLEKPEP